MLKDILKDTFTAKIVHDIIDKIHDYITTYAVNPSVVILSKEGYSTITDDPETTAATYIVNGNYYFEGCLIVCTLTPDVFEVY